MREASLKWIPPGVAVSNTQLPIMAGLAGGGGTAGCSISSGLYRKEDKTPFSLFSVQTFLTSQNDPPPFLSYNSRHGGSTNFSSGSPDPPLWRRAISLKVTWKNNGGLFDSAPSPPQASVHYLKVSMTSYHTSGSCLPSHTLCRCL